MTSSAAADSKQANGKPITRRSTPIKVPEPILKGLTEIFKQLADKSRLKILLALAQDEELHVSALCDLLRQSQPAVSHHLTLLRMTGLVSYRREGKHNFYRLDSRTVGNLLEQFFADSENGHRQFQFEDIILAYRRK